MSLLSACHKTTPIVPDTGRFVSGSPVAAVTKPTAASTNRQATSGLREVWPGVRVDVSTRLIEIEGVVAVDAHDPDTPRVYLEQMVCTPDSKEHESLVVTRAKAAHVHAALLLIGLQPGAPAQVRSDGGKLVRTASRGPGVKVKLRYTNRAGETREEHPGLWVKNAVTGTPLGDGGTWLFAGSVMREIKGTNGAGGMRYEADAAGTLIGLCSFGTETLAYSEVISPESAVDEPVWIADVSRMPRRGERVVVVLRAE